MMNTRALCCAVALAVMPAMLGGQSAGVRSATASAERPDAKVDAVFAKWTAETPGCAVGVATGGKPVLARGYGMADLEHDVRISPDSLFEAGSVSKQFTAAAVMLLAREGKLSLDDQVRKYIPELPDYEALASPKPQGGGGGLTIRHMLNHTSGLRDWGSVAGIAGWPRTTRVHTQAHMLDIVSRQHELNFTPGTRWSYSNTGFNLAAMIVARVSGWTFPEFSRTRLFMPLGMTHTSWRDDYTRIEKGRAIAYKENQDGYHTDMPFEDVYGNGGLLTTVGDLLKWNEHYDTPPSGDAPMIAEQQKPGHFNDGREHGYALGLFVGTYKGLHEVYHSGSTAGYSAFLTRFPDQHVSVAVLCNGANANATDYAHAVADVYLGDRLKPSEPVATYTLTSAEMDGFARRWMNRTTGAPISITREKDGLVQGRSTKLFAQSQTRLVTAEGEAWEFDAQGLRHTDQFGTIENYGAAIPARNVADRLDFYTGTYVSEDAETTLTAVVEGGKLRLKRRPDTTITLTPIYVNGFSADQGLGTVIFEADGQRVTTLRVVQDRVWNMKFAKAAPR